MKKGDNDEHGSLISISESEDSYSAMITAKSLAAESGFSETSQVLIATVVSELATNILRYAGNGIIVLKALNDGEEMGIEVQAIDKGPGIKNLEEAFCDNYTTSLNSLGLGLPSLKRIMDEYSVETGNNSGTIITARKWNKKNGTQLSL